MRTKNWFVKWKQKDLRIEKKEITWIGQFIMQNNIIVLCSIKKTRIEEKTQNIRENKIWEDKYIQSEQPTKQLYTTHLNWNHHSTERWRRSEMKIRIQ